MKLTKTMILTEVGDEFVAVPVGESAETFHAVIRLNKTAEVVWRGIEAGKTREEMAAALVEQYNGVDYDTAMESVNIVVSELSKGGILE